MPSNDIEEPERMLGRAQLKSLLERRIDELSDVFRTVFVLREALAQGMDLAERDVFSFDGERCDRIVAAGGAEVQLML